MRRSITRIGFALAAFIAALVVAAGLPGCQQLFTTSLAEPLARSGVNLPDTLTESQAADLAAQAKDNNDADLAKAVVGTLVDQIADPAAQIELAAAAASAAVTASGASDAIMDAFADVIESGNTDSIRADELLAQIQAGLSDDVIKALSYLDPVIGITDPAALTDTELSATDYLMAAIVLAASALPPGCDPTDTGTYDVPTFQSKEGYLSAVNILVKANGMVEPGSEEADLLSQFSALLGM
jgi:hypothetical protein